MQYLFSTIVVIRCQLHEYGTSLRNLFYFYRETTENDKIYQCILKQSHFKINCYRCNIISAETVVHSLSCLNLNCTNITCFCC